MCMQLSPSHEIIKVSKSSPSAGFKVDVSDARALSLLLEKTRPDAIINAVKPAFGADKMETEKAVSYALNTTLPQQLAEYSKASGCKLVHISTDWVYEGKEGELYAELSPTYPQNYYSYTKALAEEKVLAAAPNSLILRPEGIFGIDERGSNPLMRIMACAKEHKPFPVSSDQFAQPICAAELARIAQLLLEKNSSGIYNATGPDYLSRRDFASLLCKKFGLDVQLEDSPASARKMRIPLCLKVSIEKLEGEIGKVQPLLRQLESIKEKVNA
ncbi:RmlD substrate binding domain protein [Candidatus Anstonella stagnisolia]|nr:RmlD substrate binding domain protein [Candidatus Anstonella stagnisolia]